MKNLLSIFAFVIGFSSSAFAELFEHKFKEYPVKKEDCANITPKIKEDFEKATKTQVVGVSCDAVSYSRIDIVVKYLADSQLKLVSLWKDKGDYERSYSTFKSCEKDLKDQTAIFEIRTGLKSVLAYCFVTYSDSDYSHVATMRIDAFGIPKEKPFVMVESLLGTVDEKLEVLEEEIRKGLDPAIFHDARVVVSKDFATPKIYIRYYSKSEIPLALEEYGYFNDVEECKNQTLTLDDALAAVGSEVLYQVCAKKSWPFNAYLYNLHVASEPYSRDLFDVSYVDLKSCLDDRKRVIDIYRNQFGKDTVSAVCGMGKGLLSPSEQFYMRLFSKI